jgi:predicted amidohydrolase
MNNLSVHLIQTPLHWEDPASNLRMLDGRLAELQDGAELVLLPEMFPTGFSMSPETCAQTMDGPIVRWMEEKAKQKNIVLAGSLPIREGNAYFNRLLWVLPSGVGGYYDKRHLFAYGEEDRHYTAGEARLIARLKGWKVCLSICYDLRFPVWLRQPKEEENRYDLLVCVANWPESRAAAWDTLLRARAVENQCYVAGVNRTGVDGSGITYSGGSAVIDPEGRDLVSGGSEATTVAAVLDKKAVQEVRSRYPFLEDGDQFYIER